MLRNSVTLNGLNDDQKFFAKSYIIPTLIESGETFTNGEIAELYGINLATVCEWRKYIENEWEPNTNLCCSYSLPKIWRIKDSKLKDSKLWERTKYNPNEFSTKYLTNSERQLLYWIAQINGTKCVNIKKGE